MSRYRHTLALTSILCLALAACAPPRRSEPGGNPGVEGEGEGSAEGEGEGSREGEGEGPVLVDAGGPGEGEGEGAAEGEGEGAAEGEGEGALEAYCEASAPDTGGSAEVHHPNPCDDDGGCPEQLGCKLDHENPGSYACKGQWGPRGEGDFCMTPGECGPGLTCVSEHCVRFCVADDHCPGDRRCNGGSLNDGEGRFLTKICGSGGRTCNPLCSTRHCGLGQGCYVQPNEDEVPELVCQKPHEEAPEGAGSCSAGEGKYFASKCQPGWLCNPQTVLCQKVCNVELGELDNPGCAEGQFCGGAVHNDFPELGYCVGE